MITLPTQNKSFQIPDSKLIKELLSEANEIINGDTNLYHKLEKEEKVRFISRDAIKKICLKYRLRFLDLKYLKQKLPKSATDELTYLEESYCLKFKKLKIVGPAKVFELEMREKDPILIAELDDGRYLFIHKWGGEFNSLRALQSLPFRNFVSIVLFVGLISLTITSLMTFSHQDLTAPTFLFGTFTLWIGLTIFTLFQSVMFKFYPTSMIWNSKFLD